MNYKLNRRVFGSFHGLTSSDDIFYMIFLSLMSPGIYPDKLYPATYKGLADYRIDMMSKNSKYPRY